MNQMIQSLWIGPELSRVEQLGIKSFLHHGHRFDLYVSDMPRNVPEGTTVQNAEDILPRSRIFQYQGDGFGKGSYAGFADLFRYHLLHKRGGGWVDTDVICLKPFSIDQEVVICSSLEGKWGKLANKCVLKLPTPHPGSDSKA